MKRMLCFIAVMLLVAATAWAADYPVAHGANEQIAHATHYPKMVSVKGTQTPECKTREHCHGTEMRSTRPRRPPRYVGAVDF